MDLMLKRMFLPGYHCMEFLKGRNLVKKKILFVTQYLHTGGIEKSLLTLLSEIDYRKYEVDLMLFDYSGALFKMIPPQVNVLPPIFEAFSTPLLNAVPELMKKGHYRILIGKLFAALLAKFSPGIGTGLRWSIYRHILQKPTEHYDVAISYIDFFCNYYVTEKVSADKKIVYNHMDYTYSQGQGWPCPRLEKMAFSQCDYIVSVAEPARQSLVQFFPEYSNKIVVIQNRVSSETVRTMAKEKNVLDELNGPYKIGTVARLVEEKGVFFALESCKILLESGLDIIWYIVGNGPLKDALERKAKDLGIEEHFKLLGEKDNPYPYMQAFDVYVQPSKTEAHCVAVEEAMALCCPIVVTNIPAFQHQIENERTGLVVDTTPRDIAEGIQRILKSSKTRNYLISNLANLHERNKEELDKFYQLVN